MSDLENIVRIEHECFGPEAYPSTTFIDLLRLYGDFFFVAEAGGEVVGYISGIAMGERGHIVSMAVSPRHRRRGLGWALLSKLLDRFRKAGVKTVSLEVRIDNHAAISLYRKAGFRRVGVVKKYYSNGTDALLMALILG